MNNRCILHGHGFVMCLVISDVVRLCSLEYIEGDCKLHETAGYGGSSHACVCNTDFATGLPYHNLHYRLLFGCLFFQDYDVHTLYRMLNYDSR